MPPTVLLRLLVAAPAAVLVSVAATTALPAGTAARAVAPVEVSARTSAPERVSGTSRHDARLVLADLTPPTASVPDETAPVSEDRGAHSRGGPQPARRAAVQAPAVVPVQEAVAVPVEAPAVVPVAAADVAAVPVPAPETQPAPAPEPAPEATAESEAVAEPEPKPVAEPEPEPVPAPEPAPEADAEPEAVAEPEVLAEQESVAASEPAPEPASAAVPAPAETRAAALAPVPLPAAPAELVRRTGEERAAAGCPELTVDPQLTAAARRHASDMTAGQFFSHTGSDGFSASERAADAGFSSSVGENLAAGQASARAVVDDWSTSPGHRDNMLDCGWTRTGAAYDGGQVGPGMTGVWVQVFG